MLVKRTDPVLVECVVRGYITGSAWKEYKDQGTLAGEPLPEGLVESGRLEPLDLLPRHQGPGGRSRREHHLRGRGRSSLGPDLAHELRHQALEIYAFGSRTAEERGIILADTKFEFGKLPDGKILLIDEVMTPDSSRFWPREHYQTGRGPTFPGQAAHSGLSGRPSGLGQEAAPSRPPREVVQASTDRYLEIFRRLTGIGAGFLSPAPVRITL